MIGVNSSLELPIPETLSADAYNLLIASDVLSGDLVWGRSHVFTSDWEGRVTVPIQLPIQSYIHL